MESQELRTDVPDVQEQAEAQSQVQTEAQSQVEEQQQSQVEEELQPEIVAEEPQQPQADAELLPQTAEDEQPQIQAVSDEQHQVADEEQHQVADTKQADVTEEAPSQTQADPDVQEKSNTDIQPQDIVDFSEEESQLAASQDELQIEEHEGLDEDDDASLVPANSYNDADRQSLIATLAKLLEERPVQELKGEVEAIKVAFYKRFGIDQDRARSTFVADGGAVEDFKWTDDGLDDKFKAQFAKYKQLRADYAQRVEKEREANLKQKLALIEELKLLFDRQDDFNKVFNDFKALQAKWRSVGAVPLANQKEVWDAYNYNVEKFYDVVKINRELRELDFKKNFELKQLLCEKAEEALLDPDITKASRDLHKYHEQWRDIGPVAAEFRESLWERFKNATAQLNKKHTDYYETLRAEQLGNLNLKIALCERTEELVAEAPATTQKAWSEKTQLLLDIQKMWKTIGTVQRKDSAKVYQRFRNACDAFFNARHNFIADQRNAQNNNLQQKLELCVQAEVLADSTDWRSTTEELIKLQAQWKSIGNVPPRQTEAVWKRFRTACNKFFDHKKEFFATQDARYDENLKKKEELIAEIKSYQSNSDPSEHLNAIKAFQQRWTEIGYVAMKHKDRIQNSYRAAIDALFDSLRLSRGDRQLMDFKSRIATSVGGDRRTLTVEQERLMQQLRKLESDVKLWENNIGFFAHSKNAGALVQGVQNNIDKAKSEIEIVKKKLKVLSDEAAAKAAATKDTDDAAADEAKKGSGEKNARRGRRNRGTKKQG